MGMFTKLLKRKGDSTVGADLQPKQAWADQKTKRGEPVRNYDTKYPTRAILRGKGAVRARNETDESGLDKAYADSSNLHLDDEGTLYVAGTKGNFWGREWLENYATMGVPLVANALGMQAPYAIEDNERYKQLDKFIKEHPGQVKNLVGHSKGAAVIHTWMKNNPDFKGESRLYATPYEDVLGKEQAKKNIDEFNAVRNAFYDQRTYKDPLEKFLVDTAVDKFSNFLGLDKVEPVKGETRIANEGDPAAILDGSAQRYTHQNPFKYISSGGPHDYHEGIAQFTSGFGKTSTERPGGIDSNYRNPFNLSKDFTWQAPKMDTTTATSWTNPDGSTSVTK